MSRPAESKRRFSWMFRCFSNKNHVNTVQKTTRDSIDQPKQFPNANFGDLHFDFRPEYSVAHILVNKTKNEFRQQNLSTLVNYEPASYSFSEMSHTDNDDENILMPDVKCYHLPFNNYVRNNAMDDNDLMMGLRNIHHNSNQSDDNMERSRPTRRSFDDSCLGDDLHDIAFSGRRISDVGSFEPQRKIHSKDTVFREMRVQDEETAECGFDSGRVGQKVSSQPTVEKTPKDIEPNRPIQTVAKPPREIGPNRPIQTGRIPNQEPGPSLNSKQRVEIIDIAQRSRSTVDDSDGSFQEDAKTRPFRGSELVGWLQKKAENSISDQEANRFGQNLLSSGYISCIDFRSNLRFDVNNFYVLGKNY